MEVWRTDGFLILRFHFRGVSSEPPPVQTINTCFVSNIPVFFLGFGLPKSTRLPQKNRSFALGPSPLDFVVPRFCWTFFGQVNIPHVPILLQQKIHVALNLYHQRFEDVFLKYTKVFKTPISRHTTPLFVNKCNPKIFRPFQFRVTRHPPQKKRLRLRPSSTHLAVEVSTHLKKICSPKTPKGMSARVSKPPPVWRPFSGCHVWRVWCFHRRGQEP